MYKLFLCLRYLRSRVIAYFAVLGVALCVAMMLIAISVMDGFLRKIELAAKGLFGDIVVESASLSGVGMYDEFIAELTGEPYRIEAEFTRADDGDGPAWQADADGAQAGFPRATIESGGGLALQAVGRWADGHVPGQLRVLAGNRLGFRPARTGAIPDAVESLEVRARVSRGVEGVADASPFILTFGILRVPQQNYRTTVQVAGIRLPGRADVSDFEEGLWVQQDAAAPTWSPEIDQVLAAVRKDADRVGEILAEVRRTAETEGMTPARRTLIDRLQTALSFHFTAEARLRTAVRAAELEGELELARRRGADTDTLMEMESELAAMQEASGYQPPADRIILGLGIRGLSFRTDEGETVRVLVPGLSVELVLVPLGRRHTGTDLTPNQRRLTIVDDCQTDVSSIDREVVYVPFETLQLLNNMGAEYAAEPPHELVTPARCSQIHVRASGVNNERELERVRVGVADAWADFQQRFPAAAETDVSVLTWRQRQADVVGPIEKQRTLTMIMFGIISLVAVVLIFVIFYMIVFQKTRDIGVLKAIGASSGGVAGVFLMYGAAVGLVGAILGSIGGYYFVRYINPIQDWVDRTFGFRVWERDVFMFEKIPNEVQPATMVWIAVSAVAAGLVGALLPAWRAARMQPVEALRYE